MTPSDIEVLLHFYTCPEPHPREDAPAVRDAINGFLTAGLLIRRPSSRPCDVYEVTDGGRMLVEMLCATPFPERRWVDPREERQ